MTTSRHWRPARPLDVAATWGRLRRGGGDPTWREPGDGRIWWGMRTPHGPATLALAVDRGGGTVDARAWGEAAGWVLDRLPEMLGEGDDPGGFVPRHPLVAEAVRRFPGWRVPRTGMVMSALVPTVVEQRVTGAEAFGAWRRLVRRFGTRAPGPTGELDLWVAPSAQEWARVPSWEWRTVGVEGARSDTVVRACRYAGRLEQCAALTHEEAHRRLRGIPGVGVWTAAEVRQRALGDPDAVSFGDYHVAKDVGWALVGHEVDDAGMAELLEPWAGHRYRVQRLLELVGAHRPRRGPRMALPTHLPVARPGGRARPRAVARRLAG
ncbi:MAG TPA: DNA-3-methyladenine glycosylase 2 family protein [Segeticoccus sp.]|nr:DNA-3-methyladenine glycosylase 2 family protein [Segeticoccus sp.]